MTDTLIKTLSEVQLERLRRFALKVNNFGANFACFDIERKPLFWGFIQSDDETLNVMADIAFKSLENIDDPVLTCQQRPNMIVSKITSADETNVIAVIDIVSDYITDQTKVDHFCKENHINPSDLSQLFAECSPQRQCLAEMLSALQEDFNSTSTINEQLDLVSSELAQAYEELALLYNLSTNMKVTHSNASYLQMACDQITQIVNVEGIAVLIKDELSEGGESYKIIAGSGYISFDLSTADILETRLLMEMKAGKDALLDSQIDSPYKYEWPGSVRNIIAVPLQGSDKMFGIVVATNSLDKPDFDSIDIKLFTSVSNQCAVFVENDHLFCDLKDLFIGSLKALTNSIDAKDKYTRGHSERVAFISRWIAEQYAIHHYLEEDQIHKIYLSGLLHDIGKIGINEVVLQKKGKLSEDQLNQIKAHPRIGAAILDDIKQMRDIVPGVLYHHEHVDGTGYPEGLTGDKIPLIGKIIGLADAFDAMTSKRVYREAMSIKNALAEVKNNMGTQFDEEIARVFIQSDIQKLWNIIHDGFIESWDYSNFAEYGAKAVGTLLRA